MIKTRRSLKAVTKDFDKEIRRLKKIDSESQQKFVSSTISTNELRLLTETVFFRGFRSYENFIRDVFLLYCQEKETLNGKKVNSYLNPKNFLHTENLIRSSMNFLDWNSPDLVISRAELYLKNGYPIKTVFTSHRERLKKYKKIRNHIAHNSIESYNQYLKVVKVHFGVIPLNVPVPGEFLLLTVPNDPTNYYLSQFFEKMTDLSEEITKVI